MSSLQRPTGPRIQRSPSPAPFTRPETRPLNIQGKSTPTPTRLQIPGAEASTPPAAELNPYPSPAPSANLYPPSARQRPRPLTPRLNLGAISAPKTNNNGNSNSSDHSLDSDSPTYSYYGGGPAPLQLSVDSVDQPTIRPSSTGQNSREQPLDDISDLRRTINEISTEEVRTPSSYGQEEWSDEVLEDIQRLGEGAGGAVHKVRDRRTDLILARKTITTRETPPRQLLRELSFMRSTVHRNICHFYGAYISPSSSEVKVLMEVCEGGSLEAVGKRIKELGGRVGEKVAGRIAEGVRIFPLVQLTPANLPTAYLMLCYSRSSRALRIYTPKRSFTATSSLRISFSPRRV